MGGEFDSRTYKGKHTKKEIEELFKKDTEKALYEYGHGGYTGTIAEFGHKKKLKIVWSKKIVANESRCEEVIHEEQTSKWDSPVGVFYKSVEGKGCVVGGWCSQ